MLKGAIKDKQTVTSDGEVLRDLIEGVSIKEMSNIITRNGVTTELFRKDWQLDSGIIEHIIHVKLRPHSISAWHIHEFQTDRIFVTEGTINLVLFDARNKSSTFQRINELRISSLRPMTISFPPGIWHGIQNLDETTSSFINYFDRAYNHNDPDEWRLPADTDEIPYRFK